ncbi:hypothetical protein FKO01_11775 [Mesorhizobium sp. B2-3-3]|nr:hypothetical protein FJ958_06750 [Mesorhizobium sp. B2-3-5]TPN34107.1 hypothetical protein FKO01_11775 [Mesorhizobium sp. B2-3-3]
MLLMNGRPPLRRASLATSPPIDGVEEGREAIPAGIFPLPPEGGEVALQSGDGLGEAILAALDGKLTGNIVAFDLRFVFTPRSHD